MKQRTIPFYPFVSVSRCLEMLKQARFSAAGFANYAIHGVHYTANGSKNVAGNITTCWLYMRG